MGTAPRLAARPRAGLAVVTVTLLMAALACGLAALLTAGPAQAAPPGSVVWKKTPDPTKGQDRLYLSARGPSGSLYAAGMAGSNKGDIWITRYKASGAVQWSVRWDDAKHKMDVARAMAVDAAGNVYVCGYVDGTTTITDSVVVKYSATGKKKWASVKRFGGYEEASAIGLDSSGNAYVTGHEQPVDGRSLLYVAKFTAAKGAVTWTWLQDTPDTDSSGGAIAVTRTGTCYAAGTIVALSAASDSSGYLVKVTGGARDWEKTYAGAAGKTDWWLAAELAPAGGVVVAGSTGLGGPGDFVAARYTEAGDRPWIGTYDFPGTYTTELLEDLAVAGTAASGSAARRTTTWTPTPSGAARSSGGARRVTRRALPSARLPRRPCWRRSRSTRPGTRTWPAACCAAPAPTASPRSSRRRARARG